MMAGFILPPLIGIATAWIMTNVVVSDLDWQGKYIKAERNPKTIPEIYDEEVTSDKRSWLIRWLDEFLSEKRDWLSTNRKVLVDTYW